VDLHSTDNEITVQSFIHPRTFTHPHTQAGRQIQRRRHTEVLLFVWTTNAMTEQSRIQGYRSAANPLTTPSHAWASLPYLTTAPPRYKSMFSDESLMLHMDRGTSYFESRGTDPSRIQFNEALRIRRRGGGGGCFFVGLGVIICII
jgi:hypothetical protein